MTRAAGGRWTITRLPVRPGDVRVVLEAFGWRGVARRVWYVARLRSGWFRRRLPVSSVDAPGVEPVPRCRSLDVAAIRRRYEEAGILDDCRADAVAAADRLLAGTWVLYGGLAVDAGFPPPWTVHPLTGAASPAVHWTAISDDDAGFGDVKDVWELSRFGGTFVLARAYVLSRDARYADAWWRAVESWAAANPPNQGVNWRCAQESALRAIAWSFGWSVFGADPCSTAARGDLLGRLLAHTRRRIRPTLGYALSQRNNHAVSELVFLLGLPGRDRRAERLLREVLRDQFASDGSYVQQSLVYHRLAVDLLAWLLWAAPALPDHLRTRVVTVLRTSATFLARCSDPVSGELMNYGANDGTSLLPLGGSRPLDVAPTLALLGVGGVPAERRELSLWLAPLATEPGAAAERQPPDDAGARPRSTYVTLRGRRSALLTRVGTRRGRAGDRDQQAVELFIDGRRVVVDPGTFRYSGAPPWRLPFVDAAVPSMATAASACAERRAIGRFLRPPMEDAELVQWTRRGDDVDVAVSRRRAGDVTLTRRLLRLGDRYAVVDEASGGPALVRWNLLDLDLVATADGRWTGCGPAQVALDGGDARRLVRSPDDPASGWWSPTYGVRQPCDVIVVELADGAAAVARFAPADEPLPSLEDVHAVFGGADAS